MWIKICANTSLLDAGLAAESGADAVGFVFAQSPRRVTAHQAAAITRELPSDLTRIGVFLTREFEEIAATARTAALHGIQLHGGLDLPLIDRLRSAFGASCFLIQTLHWHLDRDPAAAEQSLREDLRAVAAHGAIDAVLLDAKTSAASGGTGRAIDWARAQRILAAEAGDLRIILAGGLHPENVAEAIHTLHPWGVDVASGVERSRGKKDPDRLQAFITAARAAFAEVEKLARPAPCL